MAININTAISALDTPTSLLPFFVKDSFDVTGRTIMAGNEGGKHEAREKFIEEAGTSAFWIGGIPLVRWIGNKLYKNKIDSEIHFKRINTEGIQSYFANELKDSKTQELKFSKKDLKGIVLNSKKLSEIKNKLVKADFKVNKTKGFYRKYHIGVTAAAVLINLAILSVAIPQLNLYLSRKLISKEAKGQKNGINTTPYDTLLFGKNKQASLPHFLSKTSFNKNEKSFNNNKPSFGALKEFFEIKTLFDFPSMAEKAQLAPVNGMLLLDYGISGSRVTITPRNNNERIENIVKEGGIIFFFYYASEVIKNKLAEIANKWFNIPIDLDYKVLNSKEFKNVFTNKFKQHEILKFANLEKDDANAELKVIKFIDTELAKAPQGINKNKVFNNFTLKMAQKEGLIDIEYDDSLGKWIRHSKKYIETEKVIALNNNLKNFYAKAIKTSSKIELEKVISKTKNVKIAAIFGNMAICCASLSFILPKIQYIIREFRTETKQAPGIKHYQEMAENNQLRV